MQLTKGAIGNLINRYKAVLKKCHLLNVFGSLAVAGMLVMGGAGVAVAVDDLPLEGEHTYDSEKDPNVNHLMGGWLVKEDATTEATGDITLDVKGGTISEIIGGSYVKANSAFNGTLTHGTITTTIEGTTSSQFVVGGSKIANSEKANLKTGDISLTIKDGTFGQKDDGKPTDYELVMGGNYLKADLNANDTSKAEAGHITVNIDDGEFKTSVAGGSTAHVYNGNSGAAPKLDVTDASTSVTITGGTFDHSQSTGGGAINLDPSIIGGGLALVADGITAEGVSASSTITGNTLVTIAQAEGKELIINDKVLGGSLAQGKGATVTIGTEGGKSTSAVIVDNVSKVGDLVGGNMAQGGMAILHGDSFVEVKAGQVEGDIMGGSYVRGAGTVTTNGNTSVVFSAANLATMPQAEYIVGGDKVLGNDTAKGKIKGTSSVTINNNASVTTGAVVGGSFSRATPGTAEATVANSVVTINGGQSIAGVVGGGLAEHLTGTGSAKSVVEGKSSVVINGGTVTNIVYTTSSGKKASSYAAVAGAGFATGENASASVGNSVVVIDGAETVIKGNQPASKAAVVGGGVASAKGTSGKVMSSVTTANTTINGGTINGNVFAGGLADGTSATANVTNANLTISGNAVITGNIHAGGYALNAGTATVANATVTFDGNSSFANKVFGQGHADDTSNATVTNSTLAFTNYNGAFNGQVVGFNNLDVAEGSTLQLATLSTGVAAEGDTSGVFNNNDLTLTGSGVVSADKVVADKALTVDSLATLTSGDIAVTTGSVTVEGTLDATGTVVTTTQDDINVAKGGILNVTTATALNGDFAGADLANGGTVNLTGTTDGELTVANLQGKFGSVGIINAGDNTVAGMFTEGTDPSSGTVSIDDITKSNIATNETKRLVVTGVTSTSELNGAWKGVELAEGASLTVNAGTLQLTGDAANVAVVNGDVAFNKNDSTLMLGDAGTANSGVIAGDVTFSNSASNMTLLVTGNQNAAFVVEGDIDGQGGTKGQLIAQGGATLTAKGDITAGTMTADGSAILAAGAADPAGAAGDIVAKNITAQNGGTIAAINDVTVTNVTLSNGAIAAGGDLTLNNGATNASGALVAGANIKATGQNLTKAADGQLSLIADGTITAKDITATNVVAKTLTTTGDVAVDGGILSLTSTEAAASTVESLKLTNGTQAVIEGSLKLDGTNKTLTVGTGDDTVGGTTLSAKHIDLNDGMLIVDPDWGLASSNVAVESMGTPPTGTTPATYDDVVLNGRVGVGQNSYLALGTADTTWLPGVVAGYTNGTGLSQTGITAAMGLYKGITIGTGKALLVDGSKMDTATGSALTNAVNAAANNSATFADNSLLVINGADDAIAAGGAAISFETTGTLSVAEGAKLLITDAVAGQAYTIVDNVNAPTATGLAGWKNNGMTSTTDMISLDDAVFTPGSTGAAGTVTTSAKRNDAATVFPNLSDGMANAVNDLYTGHDGAAGEPRWDYADVDSADMGVRFLSRATDNRFLGADKDAAAATIESAARIAFAGAVPQMTKMASDAGTNAVVNRLGFANPADGAQAMDAEGKIVDRNTTGFALWIAPLWQSQHGWGMEADNLDYGFNGNLGGVSLGADYTFENAIRAGITFNIGGGYAESSGGDLNSTENRMSFWGLGAYAGWNYENFGLMADVSYTSTWNDLQQDMDSRMGMGDLEADVQASAISAGLRAEYKLETSVLDVIPHIGVRYMSLNTWGFDAESNGGTVLEGDGFHQDIWTFPVGVTFTKDFTLDSGWSFKPSIDFSVIPAAGDIKAKQDVAFTGLPGTYEVETQMMDYLTWQGGVGLELGNDTMSFGVNYTLQAGQHTTGHGVFGSFRYEF